MPTQPAAPKSGPTTAPRTDRQADDEYCVCCEEPCDCEDCEDCEECAAEERRDLPIKRRWTEGAAAGSAPSSPRRRNRR